MEHFCFSFRNTNFWRCSSLEFFPAGFGFISSLRVYLALSYVKSLHSVKLIWDKMSFFYSVTHSLYKNESNYFTVDPELLFLWQKRGDNTYPVGTREYYIRVISIIDIHRKSVLSNMIKMCNTLCRFQCSSCRVVIFSLINI